MVEKIPTLSFCIAYQGQFQQIRHTLRKNLNDNRRYKNIIEFIIVDFKESDGLKNWIISEFYEDVCSGYLRHDACKTCWDVNIQTAKNTAFWYAHNDIVSDLDCHQYTGYLGGQYIINRFMRFNSECILRQLQNDINIDKISIKREVFNLIGGFDEQIDCAYYKDDLIARLRYIGVHCIHCNEPIYNQIAETSDSTEDEYDFVTRYINGRNRSSDNIADGILVANKGTYGIRLEIALYNEKIE